MKMKYLITPLILSACLLTAAPAREPVWLGDWARITLPETYTLNEPFPVTVEVLKLDAPANLSISANWKKDSGQFGGFLQFLKSLDLTEPGRHELMLTVRKDKPNLKTAVITVYLSPDGVWKNRSASGTADLQKKLSKSQMELLAEKSEQTQKAAPFSSETSRDLPSLKAAGFAETPGFEDNFDPGWPKRKGNWQVAGWKQNGTQMSPERAKVNGDGDLVLTVKAGKPFQGGSIQSTREFAYGRWVARVKTASVPGVLNSIFTKDWDDKKTPGDEHDGQKGEIDIEILSHTFGPGTGEVHLAIHLKDHTPLWHLDIPLDFNPSEDYHEWGFDVFPDRIVWHVDGKILHTWNYTDKFFIHPDYEFFFNAWTMEKWIQGPPAADAHYHIDWVRFYPLLEDE